LGHLLLYSRIKLLLSELFPCDGFRRVEKTFEVVEGVIGWSRGYDPIGIKLRQEDR
jgi:hypothetical protein